MNFRIDFDLQGFRATGFVRSHLEIKFIFDKFLYVEKPGETFLRVGFESYKDLLGKLHVNIL